MLKEWRSYVSLVCLMLLLRVFSAAQEVHDPMAPERLGEVSFPISCGPGTQKEFNRGVALLHSFAYTAANDAFQSVSEKDPKCAMASWGMAMTHFHQLWEPFLSPATVALGRGEMERARLIGAHTERERRFVHALGLIYKDGQNDKDGRNYQDDAAVPYHVRALSYERAMSDIARRYPNDVEAQVFYALALLSNASPADKTHGRQRHAADLLEPLYRTHPQHPGVPHYLIHAYDNAELAPRGLSAARTYAKIAPSAPHALHMPSHIFTRLGLWEDSISSNIAAREAAHKQGDTGEELHAMDHLVYAYLQSGRDADAAQIVEQLRSMPKAGGGDFKVGYAATAMPVRYAVERSQWADAVSIVAPLDAPPQVVAIAEWARGMGLARSQRPAEAHEEIDRLGSIEEELRTRGNAYWASQVRTMRKEVMAWSAQAENRPEEAVALMREAADVEDAIEKLPVTPGPIVPAREQLGELLLEQGRGELASKEFITALANAPGRRGALRGAARAAQISLRR